MSLNDTQWSDLQHSWTVGILESAVTICRKTQPLDSGGFPFQKEKDFGRLCNYITRAAFGNIWQLGNLCGYGCPTFPFCGSQRPSDSNRLSMAPGGPHGERSPISARQESPALHPKHLSYNHSDVWSCSVEGQDQTRSWPGVKHYLGWRCQLEWEVVHPPI